jgi:hypothetical protein
MKKVIAHVKGGLGNQMFCYAAARRLALVEEAELVIDDVSGFAGDHQYQRHYGLDHFHIEARKATAKERLEPCARYRRGLMKLWADRKPFAERHYLEQQGVDYDPRLLAFKVNGTVYLDGYWQSENYFRDVENTIRKDLQIIPPADARNQRVANQIRDCLAVALHVRWFDPPGSSAGHNVSAKYYERAIALIETKIGSPHYFVFSDDPEKARLRLALPEGRVTYVSHNRGESDAYADLWLMTQCQHFITANSTFSWWGAWLGSGAGKIVITTGVKLDGKTAWGFKGLIPEGWLQV